MDKSLENELKAGQKEQTALNMTQNQTFNEKVTPEEVIKRIETICSNDKNKRKRRKTVSCSNS